MPTSRHSSKVTGHEVLHIRVTGGNADQPMTLLARMADDGKRFFSYAHYLTDSRGHVDLTKSASQGGLYTGYNLIYSIAHLQFILQIFSCFKIIRTDFFIMFILRIYKNINAYIFVNPVFPLRSATSSG